MEQFKEKWDFVYGLKEFQWLKFIFVKAFEWKTFQNMTEKYETFWNKSLL